MQMDRIELMLEGNNTIQNGSFGMFFLTYHLPTMIILFYVILQTRCLFYVVWTTCGWGKIHIQGACCLGNSILW